MRTRTRLVLLVVAAALVLAGCASTDALNNTKWSLATLAGQPLLAGTKVTLGFADGQLTGSDGCNQYSTSYTVEGSKIAIGKEIISTLMACDEPIMQQASAFSDALPKAVAFKSDGQQLILLDAAGNALATFTASGE
ncbi:MAG: META domain-containing protein [Chloroflexi bacterium]|nr:META domain-containing protein [Chloroflexota bacterium]